MFAHFGLTGPIILTASEIIDVWLRRANRPVQAFLDLKPALSEEQLDRRLLREFESHARQQLRTILKELLPPVFNKYNSRPQPTAARTARQPGYKGAKA